MLSSNHQAQIIALIVVGICLVIFCVVRDRRARELMQVRYVSETAQRVVLPALPGRLGPLRAALSFPRCAAVADQQVREGWRGFRFVRSADTWSA
ncbi:hypothetical protein GCM10009646_34610 [Streptomyces aureus]